LFVREVMRSKVVALPAASTLGEMWRSLSAEHHQQQRLLPVVKDDGHLVGVFTRHDIRDRLQRDVDATLQRTLGELVRAETVETYPDEPLRVVVYRMAENGFTRMPVVERTTRKFLGLVSLDDLLKARARHLEEERRRERPLKLRFLLPGGRITEETRTPMA
jgi:CIC family chloride channel protein